jgi:hypothetical protein
MSCRALHAVGVGRREASGPGKGAEQERARDRGGQLPSPGQRQRPLPAERAPPTPGQRPPPRRLDADGGGERQRFRLQHRFLHFFRLLGQPERHLEGLAAPLETLLVPSQEHQGLQKVNRSTIHPRHLPARRRVQCQTLQMQAVPKSFWTLA